MPKPKSEKTLLSEEKLKKKIEVYAASVSLTHSPIPSPKLGAKLKSNWDTVLVRKGKFPYYHAGFWRKLYDEYMKLCKVDSTGFKPNGSYLFLLGGNKVTIVQPDLFGSWTRERSIGGLAVDLVKGHGSPVHQVLQHPYEDLAVAMDWPDELGKTKVYAHVGSQIVKAQLPELYKPGDGLNPNFNIGTDWGFLEGYIKTRRQIGNPIKLQTVCGIVKKISKNLAVQEQEAEMKKLAGKEIF